MIFHLSQRAKFTLTGQDRVRYLNGQVTQDVRMASGQKALYACVTDVKGRITADLFFHAKTESLILDAEPELRESLAMRLERYIIADDVVLEDITESYDLWHLCGEDAERYVGHGSALQVDRLGMVGVDLWLKPGEMLPFDPGLASDMDEWERLRIRQGIPRLPAELNAEVFPPEAGLETAAMSYTKGCYIGQEILSRIRTTGKMPQRLVRLVSKEKLVVGMELCQPGEPERALGRITSAVDDGDAGWVALGYVKQAVAVPDSVLLARSEVSTLAAIVTIFSLVIR
jgi:tRNA-modifying protein YgfZ